MAFGGNMLLKSLSFWDAGSVRLKCTSHNLSFLIRLVMDNALHSLCGAFIVGQMCPFYRVFYVKFLLVEAFSDGQL